MDYLHGFPEWVAVVFEHWHGWVSGGVLAFVLEIGDRLKKWEIKPKTFAVILGVGLLWSVFAAWRDEHHNTEQMISEKTALWSQYNQCDKERAVKASLVDTYVSQIAAQQETLDREQDTFNRCIVTLQQVSIPERQRITVKEVRALSLTSEDKPIVVWTVVAFTNKVISPARGELTCEGGFSFQTVAVPEAVGRFTPTLFSRKQVDAKQVEFGMQSPPWTPDSPLVFTLVTAGPDSALGACVIALD